MLCCYAAPAFERADHTGPHWPTDPLSALTGPPAPPTQSLSPGLQSAVMQPCSSIDIASAYFLIPSSRRCTPDSALLFPRVPWALLTCISLCYHSFRFPHRCRCPASHCCHVCSGSFGADAAEDKGKRKTSLLVFEGEADAESIAYAPVVPRPLSHLPPAPGDHERSPTLDDVRVLSL